MVCATSKGSDQYAQSDQSLSSSLEYSMNVKLLAEHHLEFLSLKRGCICTDSYESTLVKMPHCWKSHATAQITKLIFNYPNKINFQLHSYLTRHYLVIEIVFVDVIFMNVEFKEVSNCIHLN